ncbi:hypothetical protein PM10SUCC1_36040 [Propionigenium maris DSM 9537]|uniref:histidine kinase n=1 Tax=Propionigenium maris DSM 9537 TaxID=1123000 RepID=A0A9W6GPM0_9FUSO|nr:HAMP domain-containing sensor histidine kinase [Propionigenium maris]GLI58090.1 hypothetical protein PM10SUCC1_36040 [Propionigenium maris DSM 9537]
MKVKNKLFLLIGMIMGVIILFTHIFNELYLESYYFNVKKKELFELAELIKDSQREVELGKLEEENNISINLIPFEIIEEGAIDLPLYRGKEILALREKMKGVIYKKDKGEFFNDENLILLTAFDSSRLLTISTPMRSIREPMAIITAFHVKIILLAALIGLIISKFVSVLITRPLVQIEEVAERVAHLDFTKKINRGSKDEIGNLGRSINEMSRQLEENIQELNKAKTQLEAANKKLQEDIEKERRIEEMRREFISSVSHELKTPIAVINNYAEALIDGIAADEDTRDFYLKVIHEETEGMDKLVKSLLLLSKLERGYEQIKQEEVSLKKVIEKELQKTAPIFEKNGLRLRQEMKDLVFIGDPDKLTMVIRNFISNSLKYTPRGGEVAINLEEREGRGRFEIYNTASVAEDVLERLWDPFYREDKVRKREEGTGLGLTIVREILEKHGFNLGIERHGEGIMFWFEEGK